MWLIVLRLLLWGPQAMYRDFNAVETSGWSLDVGQPTKNHPKHFSNAIKTFQNTNASWRRLLCRQTALMLSSENVKMSSVFYNFHPTSMSLFRPRTHSNVLMTIAVTGWTTLAGSRAAGPLGIPVTPVAAAHRADINRLQQAWNRDSPLLPDFITRVQHVLPGCDLCFFSLCLALFSHTLLCPCESKFTQAAHRSVSFSPA